MAGQFIVAAPVVVMTMGDGSREHLYAGTVVPEEVDAAHFEHLLGMGFVVELDETPESEGELEEDESVGDESEGDESGDVVADLLAKNIGDILDIVGDDAVLAAAVLDAERAAEKPRVGLVKGLEEVLEADDEEAEGEDG